MACLFRTLTARYLDTYLHPSMDRSSSGRHLNVVPPIWQSFYGEELPEKRQIFDRAGFEALLRNSPGQRLRRYWFENNKRPLEQARNFNKKKAIKNMKEYLNQVGVERTVKAGFGFGWFCCGKFMFPIPQGLKIPIKSEVHVQLHIYDFSLPRRYAIKATPCDPGSRLAVSIKGKSTDSRYIDTRIQSNGRKMVMKMNTLVDILEGIPFTQSRSLRHRWIVSGEGGRRREFYTSECGHK